MTIDPNTRQARLEETISLCFGTICPEFDYVQEDGLTRLALMTVNPRHNHRFLFHRSEGANSIQELEAMREYLYEHRSQERTYTQRRCFPSP